MCVIFTVEKDACLTEDEIEAAGIANEDGWGISWPEKQKDGAMLVRWIKGLDTDEVWPLVKCLKNVPYVAHARLATAGGDGGRLTHPFPITGKVGLATEGVAKQVLFHNGHWDKWEDVFDGLVAIKQFEDRMHEIPDGEWSDSRLLAYLYSRYTKKAVLKAFLDAGRVVVMTQNETLMYGGKFTEMREGVMASNMHWDWDTYGYGSYGYDSSYTTAHGKHFNGHMPMSIPISNGKSLTKLDPLALGMSVGDTVQIDTRYHSWLEDECHGLCVRLTDVGNNFSGVDSIDGVDMPRFLFPNSSLKSLYVDIPPLETSALEKAYRKNFKVNHEIKIGHYISHKWVNKDLTTVAKYGRITRRFQVGEKNSPMCYEVWDGADKRTYTVVQANVIEHFSNTGRVPLGKLLTTRSVPQADGTTGGTG